VTAKNLGRALLTAGTVAAAVLAASAPAAGAAAPSGIVRRHGEKGAFVSDYRIDPVSNKVVFGQDLITPAISYYDYQGGGYGQVPGAPAGATYGHTAQFQRFCSGYLSYPGQFRSTTGNGTSQQFRFVNEEIGVEGRVFAVTSLKNDVQLPGSVCSPGRTLSWLPRPATPRW